MKTYTFILKAIFSISVLLRVLLIPVNAQRPDIAHLDSFLTILPKQADDTNKVKLLNDISYLYFSINPATGIKYGEKGLALSEKLNWRKGVGEPTSH